MNARGGLRLLAGLLVAAGLAAAAPASATAAAGGTIAYVHGGNVWLVTPDGQQRRQLTTDGASAPWSYPSLAPDGSVVAIHKNQLVHLAPDGTTISRVTPQPLLGPGGEPRDGDLEWVDVSPDGTKVAWGSGDYACGAPEDPTCAYASVSGVTEIDEATPVSAYGQAPSLRFASWITDARLIGSENSNSFWANLWDLGATPIRWFATADQLGSVWDFWEAEVAPNRQLIATVALRPNQEGLIVIARSATDLAAPGRPAMPTALCGIPDTKRIDASPTWSPDSRELAYADAKGIQVNTWTQPIQSDQDCATPPPRTIAPPGAISPDWGSAEPLRPPPVPQPEPQPQPAPAPAPPSAPAPGGGPVAKPPAITCKVPKVKAGAPLSRVTKQLRPCKVRVVRQRHAKVPKGRVIKLARKPGTRLPAGAKVRVYVSRGRR